MAPKRRRTPKYRHYTPKNLGVVRIEGRDHYLGRYDSPDSWEKYHRLVADYLHRANGHPSPPPSLHGYSEAVGLSIGQLMLSYCGFADGYYRKNGKPTGEFDNIRTALRPLRRLYGSTSASEFGPDALELVREDMIESGLSRNVVNARVSRIKRMFRWASKKRLVPAETYSGLAAVEGLLRGRTKARETSRVTTVPREHVAAVLPRVTPQIKAMIQVQELAGMRPQDIRNIRTGDLDMSSDVWVFRPWTHKTEHHGHARCVAIGPEAQAILKPFLKPENPTAYVFSPKEAVATLRAERRKQRKTPVTPSQRASKRKAKPQRAPGDQYTKSSYETAITRACKKADVPHWAPNRLRHNCGTKVRKLYGIEAAAAVLGNSLGMVAEVYSESNFEKAVTVMREIG